MTAFGRRAALLGAPALLAAATARAEDFPLRQVRVLVGFAPGGANDIVARLLVGKLNERLPGTTFVVENRPGAATLVAAEAVARSAPDGATLMYTSNSTYIAPMINRAAAVDPARDLVPVIMAQSAPLLLLSRPDSPARTLADMIAMAKQRPGQVTVSTPGIGGINHLAQTLLARQTGTEFVNVPYTGNAPSLTALVRGDVDFANDGTVSARSFIDQGQLRPIAVTSQERSPILPDVPTVAETLPGYVVMFWGALLAPKGTPGPILDRIHAEVAAVLRMPAVIQRIHELGAEPGGAPRAEFAQAVEAEAVRWRELVEASGIRTE